jgi:hypothetical protein
LTLFLHSPDVKERRDAPEHCIAAFLAEMDWVFAVCCVGFIRGHARLQHSCQLLPLLLPLLQVRAAFFSEERFEKQQLAPQAGEFGEGS